MKLINQLKYLLETDFAIYLWKILRANEKVSLMCRLCKRNRA